MLERYKSLFKILLMANIASILLSCTDNRDELNVESRVLRHGYQQYLNSKDLSSWKSYIDTIYSFKERGVLEPNAYILASALCVRAYHRNPKNKNKKRCIRFTMSDLTPEKVENRFDILSTSMKYLELVNDHNRSVNIQTLIRCHEVALHQNIHDCNLVDSELINQLLGET